MNKLSSFVVSSVVIGCMFVGLDTGCTFSPCGAGQQECPDGTCAPNNNVCCGGGTSCPSGTTCGAGNTCISSPVNNGVSACEGCLSAGEQCCLNLDETVDCTTIGRTCCGNHTSCPVGTACLSNGNCS